MIDDSAQLSIDFLIGFSIFMITLILVATFVSGLLVGLQSRTIDYDAVAYRTGVILTEDPGEPNAFPGVLVLNTFNEWEFIGQSQKNMVLRFGMTPYKSTPHILAPKKIESFGDTGIYNLPGDYRNRVIFGDYPYHYNISVTRVDGVKLTSVGEPYNENSQYGYIRRVILVKDPSLAQFDMYYFQGSDSDFYVDIITSEMFDATRGPVYWIDPMKEELQINLTNISNIANDGVSVKLNQVYYSYYSTVSGMYISPPQSQLTADMINTDGSTPPGFPIVGISDYIYVDIPAGYFIGKLSEISASEAKIRINYVFEAPANVTPGASYMNQTLIPPVRPELVPAVLEVRIW